MEVTTIGIDLAKSVFAVSGADSRGRVVIRPQLRRVQVLGFMRGLPRCVLGMEATGGAQYWARQFNALGHEVRLMSPALVMPYRKGNKTDRNDADAILEAVSRPSMRFVMVKSVAQQDLPLDSKPSSNFAFANRIDAGASLNQDSKWKFG